MRYCTRASSVYIFNLLEASATPSDLQDDTALKSLPKTQRFQELNRFLMTMIAYAFLQSRRLEAGGSEKKIWRAAATTEPAGHQASHS